MVIRLIGLLLVLKAKFACQKLIHHAMREMKGEVHCALQEVHKFDLKQVVWPFMLLVNISRTENIHKL